MEKFYIGFSEKPATINFEFNTLSVSEVYLMMNIH